MALPLWVVVAPFVWAPTITAAVGWALVRFDLVHRTTRVRAITIALAAVFVATLAATLTPSPVLADHATLARVGLALLCASTTVTTATLSLRARRGRRLPSEKPDPSPPPATPLRDAFTALRVAGLTVAFAFFVTDLLWGAVYLVTDDPLFDLAMQPYDDVAMFEAAQLALAAEEPAVARARAELAERAGADPTEAARIIADAWAADGHCRRAWDAIDRGTRASFERYGELRLRERVVGPTIARRCPSRTPSRTTSDASDQAADPHERAATDDDRDAGHAAPPRSGAPSTSR